MWSAGRPRYLSAVLAAGLCVAGLCVAGLCVAIPARAGIGPTVTSLSAHRYSYWGGARITVHGSGFTRVHKVLFGKVPGTAVKVESASALTVLEPEHGYGTIDVRVQTASGVSPKSAADRFTFTRPTMNSPIQGGWSAVQEQGISARVRARHENAPVARRAGRWTAAMGSTAVRRARSWFGLPYSWAGGTVAGPTLGVCASDGGDFDCHVVGFDCSGLALYAWGPYVHLPHHAATQRGQAGRFHPSVGELVPGDLVFFADNRAGTVAHVVIYAGGGVAIQAPESGWPVGTVALSKLITGAGTFRGATRPMSTGRQGSGPVVTAMTSRLPTAGGSVVITGRGLGNATSVSVGTLRFYSFTKRSAQRLVVKLPAHHAGPVRVTVYNAWGSATRTVQFVVPTP